MTNLYIAAFLLVAVVGAAVLAAMTSNRPAEELAAPLDPDVAVQGRFTIESVTPIDGGHLDMTVIASDVDEYRFLVPQKFVRMAGSFLEPGNDIVAVAGKPARRVAGVLVPKTEAGYFVVSEIGPVLRFAGG